MKCRYRVSSYDGVSREQAEALGQQEATQIAAATMRLHLPANVGAVALANGQMIYPDTEREVTVPTYLIGPLLAEGYTRVDEGRSTALGA